jgi:hypothetical protein
MRFTRTRRISFRSTWASSRTAASRSTAIKWPIDTLIVATSNNSEFNRFLAEKEEAPIVDRCRICYVSHNTNHVLQKELTAYAIGNEAKTTLTGDVMHQDPNLNYAASVGVVLTRLPRSEKLTPIETMKLAAGEVAGEKEPQDAVRGHRHPQPGARYHQTLRPEGSGAAQPRAHHPADAGELRDQRGQVHVRL